MARGHSRRRRRVKSFVRCIRQFLTSEVFKQAHQARHAKRRSPRWQAQPLVFVLLTMTWTVGDSTPERFETAKRRSAGDQNAGCMPLLVAAHNFMILGYT